MTEPVAPDESEDPTPTLEVTLAELPEVMKLISKVVASVSARIDVQTGSIAETRQAAFLAVKQTDPARFAEPVGRAVEKRLGETVADLLAVQRDISREEHRARQERSDLRAEQRQLLALIGKEHDRVQGFRQRLPFMALLALVLVLALGIALTRFMAVLPTPCAVLGGEWSDIITACVFYAE